ncbi:glyoxalase superfamily protein [Pseudomonas sp. ZB1P45]|uniref:glyoxalase superfamily protein n=1 Tax=Pseudomonas frigoris TaxID=3398356 RepID=UPI0039F0038C
MAKITIKELESLTANDAGRILREDGNLAGRISVRKDGVSVSFFYRYRWGDQNKEYACGSWPRKSLTDIRKARNQARALIDEQINPLYLGISRNGLQLHLSEHHGDASPGSTIFIPMQNIELFRDELLGKRYGYGRPDIVQQGWGQVLEVYDPFGNRIRFCQS